jgi:hypothetical protein
VTLLRRLPRPLLALLAAFGLIAALQGTPALVPAGSPAAPVAAQASIGGEQEICNSSNSVAGIKVWSTIGGSQFPWYLGMGQCHTFPQASNEIRVDVDIDNGPYDVDSYYIGVEGQGYGPCHNGENQDSDPPNVAPLYVKYNSNRSSCP